MAHDQAVRFGRRGALRGMAGLGLSLAGGTLLAGCANQVAPFFSATAGGQLETTRIRLNQIGGICIAPQYVAADLLRAEGFTDVEYVQTGADPFPGFAAGTIDMAMAF